jgi:hypothetical protein
VRPQASPAHDPLLTRVLCSIPLAKALLQAIIRASNEYKSTYVTALISAVVQTAFGVWSESPVSAAPSFLRAHRSAQPHGPSWPSTCASRPSRPTPVPARARAR